MNKEEVFNELCEEGKKITGIDVRLAPRRKNGSAPQGKSPMEVQV